MTTHYIAKPFIKWVGGKGQLLSTFAQLLPSQLGKINNLTYIEPFIGGGAMLFYMLQKFNNIQHAVINDLNPNLIIAYNTVKNQPDLLIQGLSQIQQEYLRIPEEYERKQFYLLMRDRFNNDDLSDVDKTVLFVFLNRTCFNGLYRVNSKGEFNVPFGRYANPSICDATTILADSKLLQKVQIIHGDFEQIERYLTKNTFVYIDPPYRPLNATSNFNSYAKEAFNDDEQVRLKEFVDRLSARQCFVMLSNSDCKSHNPEDSFFDELYKDYIIERVYASRAVNANPAKRGKLTELLIRNYPVTSQLTRNIPKQLTLELEITPYDQSACRKTI